MTDGIHLHGQRSAWLSAQLCTRLALPTDQVLAIAGAALRHDIGKYALPTAVLDKPGPLTPEERCLIERHCLIGAGMLLIDALPDTTASSTVAVAVVLSHHEWWNGQGYPFGLSGDAIPRGGRIVAVADVFDALVSARPYKPAWSVTAAVDHIVRRRGTQFDPLCVDALVDVAGDLTDTWQSEAHAGLVGPFPADSHRAGPSLATPAGLTSVHRGIGAAYQ